MEEKVNEMTRKGERPFSVKANTQVTVTESDIKQKYGWESSNGFKIKTPEFSMYEKFIVTLAVLGTVFVAFLNEFKVTLNFDKIVSYLAMPEWLAWVGLSAIILIIVEAIYEFIGVRGKISKPSLGEVYGNKLLALIISVASIVLILPATVASVFAGLVYANYGRTVAQRRKNFEEYLENKKREITDNNQLPVKERKEISYCENVAPMVESETSETTNSDTITTETQV